jgi:hypothetical protein
VLPLFPDYAVACGAFGAAKAGDMAPIHREIRPDPPPISDDPELFLVVARGGSMDGGVDPIRHGDPLLMRWVRHEKRADLVGQVVLVAKRNGALHSPALKRLARAGDGFALICDNPAESPVAADASISVIGRLVRRLDQREFNPLARHLHQQFKREDIAPLYREEFNVGNWNTGQVMLDGRVVLLTKLDKTAMSAGTQYVDRLVSPTTLEWKSQAQTRRDDKKGRALLESLDTGTEIHLWLRRSKKAGVFTYCGLVAPVHAEGDAPVHVTWRLLTAAPDELVKPL